MTSAPSAAVGPRATFAGFLVVGLVSTACNLASRYAFETVASYEWALVGANAVGVLSAYVLNRWFVFKPENSRVPGELARFTLVNLFGIALSWLTAVLLYRHLFPALGMRWQPDLVAHAIGIAVPVLPNYLAHRHWTFASRPQSRLR